MAVPAGVGEVAVLRAAERETAQDEWAGIESQVLPPLIALFADHLYGLEDFEFSFREAK